MDAAAAARDGAEDSELVEEVAVCYDEHSYSEASYALFEKDCFYTLKTFSQSLTTER